MFQLFKQIYDYRELLWLLVGRNLKIRYKSSVLGFFWSLLTPLFFILIYSVFAKILKFAEGVPNFLEHLIVGIIAWQFTAMCLNDSLYAVLGSSNLVKKTSFPRIILPLSTALANFVNFLLTFAVLMIYLLIAGMSFSYIILLPGIILTQLVLCVGISLIVSSANVYFRDTEHIISIMTLAWFFLTPIIYPVSKMTNAIPYTWLEHAAFLNPMSGLVCLYRRSLMDLELSPASISMVCVSIITAWLILPIGIAIFQKAQIGFGDEL